MVCYPPPRRGGRTTSSLFHGFRSPSVNSTRGYNRRPRRGRISFRRAGAATAIIGSVRTHHTPIDNCELTAPPI